MKVITLVVGTTSRYCRRASPAVHQTVVRREGGTLCIRTSLHPPPNSCKAARREGNMAQHVKLYATILLPFVSHLYLSGEARRKPRATT